MDEEVKVINVIINHLKNILESSSQDGDYNEGFCDALNYVITYIEQF